MRPRWTSASARSLPGGQGVDDRSEDANGPLLVPCEEMVIGSGQLESTTVVGAVGWSEPQRELAQLSGGGRGPALASVMRRLLERDRDVNIRLERRHRQMACALLNVGADLGESAVRLAPIAIRRRGVHGRREQRVGEAHLFAEYLDHALGRQPRPPPRPPAAE